MTEMSYLQIRGTLLENMVYRPQPGDETAAPGPHHAGDAEFQLVLLDAEGRVLVSVAPRVRGGGCATVGDPLRYRVRGVLPLHPDAVTYELRRGEVRLYAGAVPAEPPRIEAPVCRETDSILTVGWQPVEGQTATYSIVAAMDSGREYVLAVVSPSRSTRWS